MKGRFDVIDYIIVHKRWQNSIKNTYSDIHSGIDSDHYPLIAEVAVRLKAQYRHQVVRNKFQKATVDEQIKYNEQLQATPPTTLDQAGIANWILSAATDHLTKLQPTKRPFEITEETNKKIDEKQKMIQEGAADTELTEIRK